MVGKLARKIERGQISVESLLRNAPKSDRRAHRGDLKIGTIVYSGFAAATAGYVLINSVSLDDQAHSLALKVLHKHDRDIDWIPGPGKPVAVLGKPSKQATKKDNLKRSRSRGQTEASGAPKPSRRAAASEKKKRPS
jgi:hypothetical protein